MTEADLVTLAKGFLVEKAAIVVVVLLIIGALLKKTPVIQDWAIPWILAAVGIVAAWGVLGEISVATTLQGIIAAAVATWTHQLWKQTTDKRE